MGSKNYIAALFIIIFLGKMVSIDAKFLGVLFASSEVTLVSKSCPKKQLQKSLAHEYTTDNFTSGFELDYLCHTAFDIRVEDWPETLAENNFKKYSYREPRDSSIPGDKFYPPPRA